MSFSCVMQRLVQLNEVPKFHSIQTLNSKSKVPKRGKGVKKHHNGRGCDYHHAQPKNRDLVVNTHSKQSLEAHSCHKCGMVEHLANGCQTLDHFTKMF